jgi:hypothetical protein
MAKKKKTRKVRTPYLLALLLALSPANPLVADVYSKALEMILEAEPVSQALAADDTDVAILVRYIGTAQSGTAAVAAGGDLTFLSGAQGSEAAETAFECPVSGALGGIIDVSDAACDTIGEVVDTINGSCSTCVKGVWAAVILDGLRSDSSNDTLATLSATRATTVDGLGLKWDTDVFLSVTAALVPPEYRTLKPYLAGNIGAYRLVANPFLNTKTITLKANATSTYASGSSTLNVISTLVKNDYAGSETNTTLYAEAGGATTANKVFDFDEYGIQGHKHRKVLVRLTNSAAMASVTLRAYGLLATFK